jgi:hypothetical protein
MISLALLDNQMYILQLGRSFVMAYGPGWGRRYNHGD